ncbi:MULTISPECIES: hypothetical protein [Acidaminococcus]|nr:MULTISPECIES: hypothetical protein [Acidaminococcus]
MLPINSRDHRPWLHVSRVAASILHSTFTRFKYNHFEDSYRPL